MHHWPLSDCLITFDPWSYILIFIDIHLKIRNVAAPGFCHENNTHMLFPVFTDTI